LIGNLIRGGHRCAVELDAGVGVGSTVLPRLAVSKESPGSTPRSERRMRSRLMVGHRGLLHVRALLVDLNGQQLFVEFAEIPLVVLFVSATRIVTQIGMSLYLRLGAGFAELLHHDVARKAAIEVLARVYIVRREIERRRGRALSAKTR